MKLSFLGAARQVTGSMYLITLENGYNILVDCGMDYETKKNPVVNDFLFPFNPADIDLVILTHAHIDHSGNLPALVLHGYNGNILCTPATYTLTEYLLLDSANIQMQEYRQAIAKVKKSKLHTVPKPLYLDKHVIDCMERFVTIEFNKRFEVNENIHITFIKAGHLLGAASVKIEIIENNNQFNFGFTGDLGRKNSKLLQDAEFFNGINYLITEGTYGGRKHFVERKAEDELLQYITDTCIKYRGRLIIPAFSVGRTQAVVFTINQLKKQNLIPAELRVFVDSPLAIKSTDVYSNHNHLLNTEAIDFFKQHGNLFEFDGVKYLEDNDEHEEIMYYYDACIIVSAAGMVEGGRIQEHIMNNIDNPYATILIAGFCAEGTLGHRLLQGQSKIRIKNRDKNVYAKIAKTDVFSSHPDGDELIDYIIQTNSHNKLKQVFLVHGEGKQLDILKNQLAEKGINHVSVPEYLQEVKL
ncbi:MAG: MBL fold metallo-hydrolase [Bacteroidia bacterium]